jgi:hypothetical protein
MRLRARLTLGLLLVVFVASLVLVLSPLSASAPSALAATARSKDCGSIAFYTAVETDRQACDTALSHRSSLVLMIAIAGVVFGLFDAALTWGATRRRKHRREPAPSAHPRMLGDLERLVQRGKTGNPTEVERLTVLHETGAISDDHFAAHLAGVLVRLSG